MNGKEKNNWSLIGCAVFVLFIGCAHNINKRDVWTDPEAIRQMIKKEGAKNTLQEAYRVAWEKILNGVVTGKPEWLDIAIRLHSVSDAGATYQLELAIGEAIDSRPGNVLEVISQQDEAFLSGICKVVDIDDPRFDSTQLAFAEIDKRKTKLLGINDPSLKRYRDKCVQSLEDSKSDILRFYGKTDAGKVQVPGGAGR